MHADRVSTFKTIVIGIDGHPQDAEAFALATALADPGAELIVAKIAVVSRELLRGGASRLQAEVLDSAEATVDAFTEARPRAEGLAAVAEGVGAGLRDIAADSHADLIVVASSRRALLGRVFAGDALRDVLRHAPCPVAVAPVGHAATGPLTHIAVGFDGSDAAERALTEAVRLGTRDGAAVNVVEVVEPYEATAAMAGGYVGSALDDAYERARDHLARVNAEHGVDTTIATGRAAHELAAASRSADLLAIGLRHHGLLDRMLMGSTAHALLREQSAPLLITPPTAEDAARHVADALDSADEETLLERRL